MISSIDMPKGRFILHPIVPSFSAIASFFTMPLVEKKRRRKLVGLLYRLYAISIFMETIEVVWSFVFLCSCLFFVEWLLDVNYYQYLLALLW
jgi:hypothetical protein